jgi:putative membrane protein
MKFLNSLTEKEVRIVIIILYSVGVAGTILPFTRNLFIHLTPFVLLISIFLLGFFHSPRFDTPTIVVFSLIFLGSFLAEMAGVNTGRIFGQYTYGKGLGIKIHGTPLMIGLNWILLIYCTNVISEKLPAGNAVRITGASILMVLYDLVMEQIAPEMDMWTFEGGTPPWQNYAAWFIMALFFHTLIRVSGIKIKNSLAPFIFFCQSAFFIILLILFKLIE